MIEVKLKPLSVNEAWCGRRTKTAKYRRYCRDLTLMLPRKIHVPEGKLEIRFIFYLSSKLADYDNPIKPTQDIICAKYGINDNRIYRAVIDKVDVPKKEEKIEFSIIKYK